MISFDLSKHWVYDTSMTVFVSLFKGSYFKNEMGFSRQGIDESYE